MVKTMMISWMVSPCIHRSVYEFESSYVSPTPSSSYYQNRLVDWCGFFFNSNKMAAQRLGLGKQLGDGGWRNVTTLKFIDKSIVATITLHLATPSRSSDILV